MKSGENPDQGMKRIRYFPLMHPYMIHNLFVIFSLYLCSNGCLLFPNQDELTKKLQACSLSDFQEGQIGRLRVHKSGRTSLILGDTALDVSMGTPANFLQVISYSKAFLIDLYCVYSILYIVSLSMPSSTNQKGSVCFCPIFSQEVVSMHPDENEGSMTVLGHVEHKLLCLPDFDALLEAAPR